MGEPYTLPVAAKYMPDVLWRNRTFAPRCQ
jgi:hypothetical protein